VKITWATGSIVDKYLEVIVEGNDTLGGSNTNTGLATSDVHFWGNLVGETASATPAGAFARTVSADGGAIITNGTQGSVGITSFLDVNRSNSITVAADRGPIITLGTGSLTRISIAGGGPFAPEGDGDGDAGIASALVGAGGGSGGDSGGGSAGGVTSGSSGGSGTAPVDAVYAQLAEADSPSLGGGDDDDSGLDDLLSDLAGG
jgi:hypothetical protein